MKILIVMDPGILIPVTGYGGHERLVEIFAREYTKLGHEVDLLVTNGSFVQGCKIYGLGKAGFPPAKKDAYKAILNAWKFLSNNKSKYDLIHNFGRLLYLLPVLNSKVKKIMTYGREITANNINILLKFPYKKIVFTGCSEDLISRSSAKGEWHAVYNTIDFNKYQLTENLPTDAPLIFLGRIEKIKGCHTVIAVAKQTGNRLIIAGNISPLEEERKYFEEQIKPHVDGVKILYVGQVNDAQKNEWLGKSKALLMPIEWNEPFGIVMIEAMACGTPVIAFNRGSVNEVVEEGVTGLKVNTREEMIEAVKQIDAINRSKCRNHAKTRFDVSVIANQYLNLFTNDEVKKIVILSTHQPAANPRAMKEYFTLKSLGYNVKFFYAYNTAWSYKIDEEKFLKGLLNRQDLIEVGGNPIKFPFKYLLTRISLKFFKFLSFFDVYKTYSFDRVALALSLKLKSYKADLYIAHYLGALPAAIKSAARSQAPVIFDAEDFHRGEKSYYVNQEKDVIEVENKLLPKVSAITTASPLITQEYKKYYPNQYFTTVINVFSKVYLQKPSNSYKKDLKLFWFSQYLGIGRGLEIFIEALNYLPNTSISLTILGNVKSEVYKKSLIKLSNYSDSLFFMDTVPSEKIFSIAAGFDVGLAGEISNFKNKELCLSNKIFTYLLAGNCILASDMQGQREFMDQHPSIGFTYKSEDAKDLAEKIKLLYHDRSLLETCKKAASKLAEEKMNWETESIQWVRLVERLLQDSSSSKTSFQKEKNFQNSNL